MYFRFLRHRKRLVTSPPRSSAPRLPASRILARLAPLVLVMCISTGSLQAAGGDTPPKANQSKQTTDKQSTESNSRKSNSRESNSQDLVQMLPEHELWIAPKQKRVIVNGQVCLREGNLEMFACTKGTKEHESIVSVNCPAKFIHAALLAVGARVGKPVEFDPKYSPPTGTTIDVYVTWTDESGKKKDIKAQEWIKNEKTGKAMAYDWVFAGSGFARDPATGEEYYFADSGDLICVSNFPSAMLDIPIASSQANDALLFHTFTEKIPPRGTKVQLILVPRLDPKDAVKKENATILKGSK